MLLASHICLFFIFIIIINFRTQAEISQLCRGTISLHGATIQTEDSCTIVISNGGAQTFHLRATTEVERQRWVTVMELAKAREIVQIHPGKYKLQIVTIYKQIKILIFHFLCMKLLTVIVTYIYIFFLINFSHIT